MGARFEEQSVSYIHLVLISFCRMASGDTQLYIWVKIDDGGHPVEIQTTSTTSVSRLVQAVLGNDLTIVALSKVQAQSSDGVSIHVYETVGGLLQRNVGTATNPLLLQCPKEEGMEVMWLLRVVVANNCADPQKAVVIKQPRAIILMTPLTGIGPRRLDYRTQVAVFISKSS